MNTWSAYANPEVPSSTDLGDDEFVGLPAGWYPVVYQQPLHGSVEIYGSTGWRFTTAVLPELTNGMVTDEWKWRASNGVSFGEIKTVAVEIYNNQ